MTPTRQRAWVERGGIPGLLAAGAVVGARYLWQCKPRAFWLFVALAVMGLAYNRMTTRPVLCRCGVLPAPTVRGGNVVR